ncbi:UNVERIFIED_CONTAM: hypothetical protein Sradi_0214300 [Sesamum radiatum]|uniref:Retrotransposon gag protein n=1 Tax=Sesamum radiatum TaxID=300843 RepID=A0AAW2VZH6_SESRA
MVDAAGRGALIDKTPEEAQHLISTMAENYRQYGYHTDRGVFMINEVSTNDLANKLSELTAFVHQMATGQRQEVTVCGICLNPGHPTDACPSLQEGTMPNANVVGGFPGQSQRRYDPHSNFYNLGWRDHTHRSSTDLTQHLLKLHPKHRIQLATSFSQLTAQSSGKLPSQTEANLRENVSAMTLHSGKELQPVEPTSTTTKDGGKSLENTDSHTDKVDSNFVPPTSSNTCALPFPYRMSKSKEEEHEREILDIFKKVKINIPLLDAIKQIPKYAKFLKKLCTNKRKLKDKERIIFGKNVSTVINHTNVIIQLADHSYVCSMGLVEDVLVKVNHLLFPMDLHILKMGTEGLNNPASILLGRPFMKTAKTKIDVDEGTLSVEFDGKIVKFKIFEAMKYPNELQAHYQINVVDSVVYDVLEEELVGIELDLIMDLDEDNECIEFIGEVVAPSQSFGTNHTTSQTNSLQSILQAPILKLKVLPNYLQSLYLAVRETSSASIFKGLLEEQDELKLYEREVWRGGKEKTKRFHNFIRVKKQFEVGKKALLYKPRIKFTLGKLCSRWCGRFEAIKIFLHGAAKLQNLDKGNIFPHDEVGNPDDVALTSPPQSKHG